MAGVAIGLLLLLWAGWSPLREYHAALLLADIAAGEEASRWKQVTAPPRRTSYPFQVADRRYHADLYRPQQEALAGLLLVPGAAQAGKDDPRLVAFAQSLARARFNVLVPDLQSLRELKVSPENIRELTAAFQELSQPALSPGGRAGMLAFSYAAGPALLAALEPEIREQVDFIFAIGGYHDLREVLGYFTTGYFTDDEKTIYQPPNSYGKWVFILSNLDKVADPADRRRFRAMFERKQDHPAAPLDDLAEGLSPAGRRMYAFITNQDPDEVERLLNLLPEPIRRDIAALNPAARNLSRLEARLILVHGYDDPIIPFSQSKALAQAVPAERVSLYLVDGLAHVDLQPGLLGRFRLWRALSALLAQRTP